MCVTQMHPFMSFCLYVSARVFLQYLKTRPQDDQITASLRFLLSAMQVLKRKNPLTESFLVQLEVDLEGSGLDDPAKNSSFAYSLKKGVVGSLFPDPGAGLRASFFDRSGRVH